MFPVPAVLVTAGEGDEKNIITIAWAGTVCSKPPMLSISIRPSRHSFDLVQKYGEFVVNIPTAGMVEKVDACGMTSGRDIDKFKEFDLTPVPASKVSAPLIDECPVNIECSTRQVLDLGAHHMFIAEIVAVNVSDDALTDGKIDFGKFNALAYLNGEYRTVADKVGSYGFYLKK